jgi:hypothetical protein
MTDAERVKRAQEIATQYNICNIQRKEDGSGVTCNDGTPCCGGCKHLSERGCTVEAHGCRFWFCATAFNLLPLNARAELYQLIWDYEGQLFFRHDLYPIDHEDYWFMPMFRPSPS